MYNMVNLVLSKSAVGIDLACFCQLLGARINLILYFPFIIYHLGSRCVFKKKTPSPDDLLTLTVKFPNC